MLFVSCKSLNQGIKPHLGCSGRNATIFEAGAGGRVGGGTRVGCFDVA